MDSPSISSLTARASDSIAVRIKNDNFVQLTFELSGVAEPRPVEGRRPGTNLNVLLYVD